MRTYESKTIIRSILLAVLIGVAVGYLFGPRVAPIGILGKVYIQLIKAFALPLVFISILDAVLSTRLRGRQAGHLSVVLVINAIIAGAIGLTLSNVFMPGIRLGESLSGGTALSGLEGFTPKPLSLNDVVNSYIPASFGQPFVENNVIAIVLIALLLGFGLRRATLDSKSDRDSAQLWISILLRAWMHVLGYLTVLVPIAVFAVTARTVGEYGFSPFTGLAWYVGVGILGLLIHVLVVYPLWIRFVAKIPLRTFMREAKAPLAMAFGTNSSLATLPLTLNSLDDLGVDKSCSRLGACVATNFNNDGILLYEAMAVLFVAQAHGISLGLSEQILVLGLSMIAAIGVAGVPEAGVVSLSLVLTTVGLPLELLPLLLTVDWLIARFRSMVNVLSDMTVSAALYGIAGRFGSPNT